MLVTNISPFFCHVNIGKGEGHNSTDQSDLVKCNFVCRFEFCILFEDAC